MSENRLEIIMNQYGEVLTSQDFDVDTLDYSIADYHKTLLNRLDVTGTSCISIFDLHRRTHIYLSDGYHYLLGSDLDMVRNAPWDVHTDSLMHPDDQYEMTLAGMHFLKIGFTLPILEKKKAKLIAEYRIWNKDQKYIRVVEQFQAIELDRRGNIWLALCVMDVSPNQDASAPFRCHVMNYASGDLINWDEVKALSPGAVLSPRENEILGMIATGMLSKEIAAKLYISVHTVNTHRQRILEKLNADNSQEAIHYARNLGLL